MMNSGHECCDYIYTEFIFSHTGSQAQVQFSLSSRWHACSPDGAVCGWISGGPVWWLGPLAAEGELYNSNNL